jgi:hypothetical protein
VTRQLYEGRVLGQSDFFTRGSQTEADTSGSFETKHAELEGQRDYDIVPPEFATNGANEARST